MTNTNQQDTLESIIQSLQTSPVFHFSLGAKELFHSNFLAWLIQEYPDITGQLFAPYLNNPPASPRITHVYRERRNIDLTLVYEHGEQLIIENKVKSLPDVQQLEEYSREVKWYDVTKFLLLSLSQPSFLNEATQSIVLMDGTVWNYLSYKVLAQRLQALQPPVQARNSYHKQILADYCTFISHLDHLCSIFMVDWSDRTGNFFATNDDLNRLRGIRLHDMIDKMRYAQLAQAVVERLKLLKFDVIAEVKWEAAEGQVFVGSGMTRGVGLFDIKYVIMDRHHFGNPVVFGIQLQGSSFRLVLEHWEKQKARTIAEHVFHGVDGERLWFDFSNLPVTSEEYPKKGIFNQYSGTFFYRSKSIPSIPPANLVDTIVTYVELIRQDDVQIRACIAQLPNP